MTPDVRSEDENGAPGPLAGLRVLEVADEKGQYCGKLMADLGADVIKIEPPGGQLARSVGPFLDDVPPPGTEPILLALQHVEAGHNPEPGQRRRPAPLPAAYGHRRCGAGILSTGVHGGPRPGLPALEATEPSPHYVLADSLWPDGAMAQLPNIGPASLGRRWANGFLRVRSRGRAQRATHRARRRQRLAHWRPLRLHWHPGCPLLP